MDISLRERGGGARCRQGAMLHGPYVSLGKGAYPKEVIPGCSFLGTMEKDSIPTHTHMPMKVMQVVFVFPSMC